MGTSTRKNQIDTVFFPWSSQVNPIEAGDLNKPRDVDRARAQERPGGQLNAKKGNGKRGDGEKDSAALRPKAKPGRGKGGPVRRRGDDMSPDRSPPRHRGERRIIRKRVVSRGRPRSPGAGPLRSRSPGGSPPGGPLAPPRQGRRAGRSLSGGRPMRRRCQRSMSPGGKGRKRGAPPSPGGRSMSPQGPPRRKRRRMPSSMSPEPFRGKGESRGTRRRGGGGGYVGGKGNQETL